MTEDPNAIRWSGRPGHYEIWYTTINLPQKTQGLWLRYTVDAPRQGPAVPAVWGSFFDRREPKRTFGAREIHPTDSLRRTSGDLVVGVGPHEFKRDRLQGRVAGGGRDLAWDLSFAPAAHPVHLIPSAMAPVGKLQGSDVLFVNQDVRFRGEVRVDGSRLAVKDAPGCQTHLWGRKRKDAWAWGHCNSFAAGAQASFEGLSVSLAPRIVANFFYVRHEGRVYGSTTGFWWLLARSRFGVPEWRFSARTREERIEGALRARPEDMVQVTYVDPDGEPLYCCNSEVADLDLKITRRGAAPIELRAEGTAQVEFTSRRENPAVKKWI